MGDETGKVDLDCTVERSSVSSKDICPVKSGKQWKVLSRNVASMYGSQYLGRLIHYEIEDGTKGGIAGDRGTR